MIRDRETYKHYWHKAWDQSCDWDTMSAIDDASEKASGRIDQIWNDLGFILDEYYAKKTYSDDLLRLNCTGVHVDINRFLILAKIPGLITCGDVLINGQPLSGATQESLWLDMMGMKDGESEFKGHVWINMQSGQILDLTIGLYMLAKHLGGPGFPPPDFKWINYVYRSDRPEPGNYTLEYRPMLFGHRVLKSVLDLPKYLLA